MFLKSTNIILKIKRSKVADYAALTYYVKRFRRRSIYKKIQYLTFDLDLGVKVTQNVAQYPLHHVTYLATKFEVATSNRLGGDTFTSLKLLRLTV